MTPISSSASIQWERELDKMGRWGAVVKPDDRSEIVDFLLRHFGR